MPSVAVLPVLRRKAGGGAKVAPPEQGALGLGNVSGGSSGMAEGPPLTEAQGEAAEGHKGAQLQPALQPHPTPILTAAPAAPAAPAASTGGGKAAPPPVLMPGQKDGGEGRGRKAEGVSPKRGPGAAARAASPKAANELGGEGSGKAGVGEGVEEAKPQTQLVVGEIQREREELEVEMVEVEVPSGLQCDLMLESMQVRTSP